MPRLNSTTQLIRTIQILRTERQKLAERLAEIDGLFAALGTPGDSKPAAGAQPARPTAKPTARPRKRRKFGVTADKFILDLVDGKKMSSAEINAAWKEAGRSGVANNTLTKLFKDQKLKRVTAKGARGGTYSLA